MLTIHQPPTRLCDGISRREWLRVGGIGLGGLSTASLLSAPARANTPSAGFGRAKAVIQVCLLGGPPQQDTWDPKPDAPAEIRGDLGTIESSIPGYRVGALMPRTALWAHELAALRAVVTDDNAHSSSGYQMLTGVPHLPTNQENSTPKFPNQHPSTAGIVRHFSAPRHGVPSAIQLPAQIANDGNIVWPGQDAGFLGRQSDPWLIDCDPSAENFRVPDLQLPESVAQVRFDSRMRLKDRLDETFAALERGTRPQQFGKQTEAALKMLGSPEARNAFDLTQERPEVRDRYGRTRFGQSLLLSRRLVESGVRLVQVNWTRLDGGAPNNGTWDTHGSHELSMKQFLMPVMDQAFAALLDDLSQRGLLHETLVVWMGEFGRTPRINGRGGRDHWGRCFSIALGGAGIRAGTVHGESDAEAAYPLSGIVRAPDLSATVFHLLGLDPETEIRDSQGRPHPISRGRVVSEILA